MTNNVERDEAHRLMPVRIGLAVLLGVIFFLHPLPMSRDAGWFEWGCVAILLGVPFQALLAVGHLRLRTLKVWLIVCAVLGFVLAAICEHDLNPRDRWANDGEDLFFALKLVGLLFVGHCLVAAGDADRRWIARYETYFDVAWTLGVRFALALLAAVLILIILGAFGWLANVDFDLASSKRPFLDRLLIAPILVVPLIAMALTDQADYARRLRSVGLHLLNWLAAPALLCSLWLAVRAWQQGWRPGRNFDDAMTAELFAWLFLLLINSLHADGAGQRPRAAFFRYLQLALIVALAAATALLVLSLVLEYERALARAYMIMLTNSAIFLGCYVAGYVVAAVTSGPALHLLPKVNVVCALIGVAMSLAAATPFGNVNRLAVAYRVARLEAGAIPPAEFNYQYLRLYTGRYGYEALERLAAKRNGLNADEIARRAREALIKPE
ncbi:MAG TPA: hypothetical protein VMI56_06875 [Reyranella sp.]|nr:hypothetical protein [Reyranella sp.]